MYGTHILGHVNLIHFEQEMGRFLKVYKLFLRSFSECTSDVECLIIVCFIDAYHISPYCWNC